MKIKINKILLTASGLLFLIVFPYTKEVKIFKAKDVNWDIINNSSKYKQFNPAAFSFKQKYKFTEEVLNLDNSNISIKGFLKNHKHGDHNDIILTETHTDVCFMCNHDEHYNMMMLKPDNPNSELYNLEDDVLIKVKGRFKINKEKKAHSVYVLENVKLEKVLNEN